MGRRKKSTKKLGAVEGKTVEASEHSEKNEVGTQTQIQVQTPAVMEHKAEKKVEDKETNELKSEIASIKNLGYDTGYLESIAEPEKLKAEMAAAKEKIKKIEEIKKNIGKYAIPEIESKINELKEKVKDYNAVSEIQSMFESIKNEWKEIKIMKVKEDLASIELPGFENEILQIWKMFDKENIEEIEKRVIQLKQKVKERFFELQMISSITPVPTPGESVTSKPIKARPEEIFIMDFNGKILLRFARKWRVNNNSVLAKLLSETYKLQGGLKIAYSFSTRKFDVYELGLMKGTKFYIGIIATRELHSMTKQFLDKTLHLLEERYSPENLSNQGASMMLRALLNVYNKVSQVSEDINMEFALITGGGN